MGMRLTSKRRLVGWVLVLLLLVAVCFAYLYFGTSRMHSVESASSIGPAEMPPSRSAMSAPLMPGSGASTPESQAASSVDQARPARPVEVQGKALGQTLVGDAVGVEGMAQHLQALIQGGEAWQLKSALQVFAECRQAWQNVQMAYTAKQAKAGSSDRSYLLKTSEANYQACQSIPPTLLAQEGDLYKKLINGGDASAAVGYLGMMLEGKGVATAAELQWARELVYAEAMRGSVPALQMVADGDPGNATVAPLEQRAMWWVLQARLVENAYGGKEAIIAVYDKRFHQRWPQFSSSDEQKAEARARELLAGMPPLPGAK